MKRCPKCWGTGQLKDHRVLGRLARQARVEKGMLLCVAARRLGITEAFLSLLENGKRQWSRERYEKAVKLYT